MQILGRRCFGCDFSYRLTTNLTLVATMTNVRRTGKNAYLDILRWKIDRSTWADRRKQAGGVVGAADCLRRP